MENNPNNQHLYRLYNGRSAWIWNCRTWKTKNWKV